MTDFSGSKPKLRCNLAWLGLPCSQAQTGESKWDWRGYESEPEFWPHLMLRHSPHGSGDIWDDNSDYIMEPCIAAATCCKPNIAMYFKICRVMDTHSYSYKVHKLHLKVLSAHVSTFVFWCFLHFEIWGNVGDAVSTASCVFEQSILLQECASPISQPTLACKLLTSLFTAGAFFPIYFAKWLQDPCLRFAEATLCNVNLGNQLKLQ